MTIMTYDADEYAGLQFSHFEDENGNQLKTIYMEEHVILCFTGGKRLHLGRDWRGDDCYISQCKINSLSR